MPITSLFIDSRTKISGTHADFKVSLPDPVTLRGARVRVDGIRTVDTIKTVTDRNKYVYFRNPTSGFTFAELEHVAYTGVAFAQELESKTGRSAGYSANRNALVLSYGVATGIIFDDAELRSFPASAFPAGATPDNPLSINDILGSDVTIFPDEIVFEFITMAPLQDVYLCSHHLMVHESWMPLGQRNALAKLVFSSGLGTTVEGNTPHGVYYDLGDHVSLKEIDFQLRDFKGRIIPQLAPISFHLIFES